MASVEPSAIKDHMDVIAAEGESIGKIDHLRDGRIKLTKNDSPDGQHHFVPLHWVDRVDAAVRLNKTLHEIKAGTGATPRGETDVVPEVGLHDAVPARG